MFDKVKFSMLKQQVLANGQNFKNIRLHIMNIKGWLRGIHHHGSKEHMQCYLDEYHIRYNSRYIMESIFDLLIKKRYIMRQLG